MTIPRFAFLFAVPLAVLALASCTTRKTADAVPDGSLTQGYVGSDACKPCHASEFDRHSKSRHAHTLLSGTKSALGSFAPPAGPISALGKLLWDGERAVVEVPSKEDAGARVPVPIDMVLGSGKTGMTYMAIHDKGSVEIRQSYFPNERKWYFTPGMERFDKNVVAANLSMQETVECVSCHAVTPPSRPRLPEPRFFGVGCESCHGPGGEHAVAMTSGAKFETSGMKSLQGAGGARLNALCGRCHQSVESVERDRLTTKFTNRFQPFGLAKSKCFKASADKLTCVTCHDPHADAATDVKSYEQTCISCHMAPKKVCPVNATEKCISCHMPTRPAFSGVQFSVKIADHFIRIWKPGEIEKAMAER